MKELKKEKKNIHDKFDNQIQYILETEGNKDNIFGHDVKENKRNQSKEKCFEVHHIDFSGSDKSEEFDEMDIDEASNSQYFGENTAEEFDDRVSESVRLDVATCDDDDVNKAFRGFKNDVTKNISNSKIHDKLQQKKRTPYPQIMKNYKSPGQKMYTRVSADNSPQKQFDSIENKKDNIK